MLRIIMALILCLCPIRALASTLTLDIGEMGLTSVSEFGNHRYDAAFSDLNGMAIAGQALSLRLLFSTAAVHAPYEYYYLSLWLFTDGASGNIQGQGNLGRNNYTPITRDVALVSNSANGILATTIAVDRADFLEASDVAGASLDMILPASVGHVTGATLTVREKSATVPEPSSLVLLAITCILLLERRRINGTGH